MNIADYSPALVQSATFFVKAMLELSLLFVGISFFVGVLTEFLPKDKLKLLLSGKNGRGYLIGALLGSLTPFCSCSTIPITVGLLRTGASFGPVMTFLFTSPLLNPVLLALFIPLLGLRLAIMYCLLALVLSVASGFILESLRFDRFLRLEMLGMARDKGASSPPIAARQSAGLGLASVACCSDSQPIQLGTAHATCCETGTVTAAAAPVFLSLPRVEALAASPPSNRWWQIMMEALGQFRSLLPFIFTGVAIGSVIHGFMPADLVVRVAGPDNALAIPVAAVVGVPLYLRVSTMIPIAASLVSKGMGLGAVIALIIGGAGASLPELAMLKGLFKTQLLGAFLLSVFTMALMAGFAVNFLIA